MESMHYENNPSKDTRQAIGMTANGSCGVWDVEVDETLSGDEKWYLQIDGPSLYLYFRIDAPTVVRQILTFVDRSTSSANGELRVGRFMRHPVSLLWDEEAGHRCFLLIGGTGDSKARFTLAEKDLEEFTEALRQVKDDLYDEGLLSEAS